MLDFVINNYIIFIIIAIVLLLGLFGYIMDRKKYNKYREEILNEGNVEATLSAAPEINEVAERKQVDNIPDISNSVVQANIEIPEAEVQNDNKNENA